MQLVAWVVLGALAAWLSRRALGLRDGVAGFLPIVLGALFAALLGLTWGRQPDFAAMWRVSTVFVGSIGIFVMASLSTGGRLR
jgi:hypothetical protein